MGSNPVVVLPPQCPENFAALEKGSRPSSLMGSLQHPELSDDFINRQLTNARALRDKLRSQAKALKENGQRTFSHDYQDNLLGGLARYYENVNLWRKNKLADAKSVHVSADDLKAMFEKRRPLGFRSDDQWKEFQSDFSSALKSSGIDDIDVKLDGTSTTFYTMSPSKPVGHHFDSKTLAGDTSIKNRGDYDFKLYSSALVEKAQSAKCEQSSYVAKNRCLLQAFPSLASLAQKWEKNLSREVTFTAVDPRVDNPKNIIIDPSIAVPRDIDRFLGFNVFSRNYGLQNFGKRLEKICSPRNPELCWHAMEWSEKNAEQIWELYRRSYQNLGPLFWPDAAALRKKFPMIMVASEKGGEPSAVMLGKPTEAGFKITMIATDGSREGRRMGHDLFLHLKDIPEWYAEASNVLIDHALRYSLPFVPIEKAKNILIEKDIKALPAAVAQTDAYLAKLIQQRPDIRTYIYQRSLSAGDKSIDFWKIMIGNPR